MVNGALDDLLLNQVALELELRVYLKLPTSNSQIVEVKSGIEENFKKVSALGNKEDVNTRKFTVYIPYLIQVKDSLITDYPGSNIEKEKRMQAVDEFIYDLTSAKKLKKQV